MRGSVSEMRRTRATQMAARKRSDSVFSCTNRAMKSDITLTIDKDHYVAGDVIKGSVRIWLTQEVKIKDLLVKITGQARVSWNEQRSYTKGSTPIVSRKNTETYLDHVIILLKKDKIPATTRRKGSNIRPNPATSIHDATPRSSSSGSMDVDDGIFLHPGEHVFHFDFTLPKNLPSSYTGRWGQVRYTIKTVLERPWKFDIVRETDFTLAANLDLNDDPELLRPVSALGEFRSGVLCFGGGLINLEVRLSRRGYIGGEEIPFQVVIENNTTKKLHEAKVSLTQHITFKAGQKTRKISHVLATLTRGEIPPWKTDAWENDVITLPDDVLPSTERHVNTIQIKYTFTLAITYSTWRDEYTFPVTIVVGTQTFRKPVVQSYLNLLGYSVSPGSSPSTSPKLASYMKHNGNSRCRSASKPSIPASLVALDRARMRRASALPVLLPASHPSGDGRQGAPPSNSPSLGFHLHASNNKRLYTSQPLTNHQASTNLHSRSERRSSNEGLSLDGHRRDGRDRGHVTIAEMRARRLGHRKKQSRGVGEAEMKPGSTVSAPEVAVARDDADDADVAKARPDANLLAVINEGVND